MIRSPRFIRPHTIIVKNRIGEVDGDANYQQTTIKYVCVDASYGIKQSQKGIQTDDNILAIIDMNDLVAYEDAVKRTYVEPLEFEKFEDTSKYFTIRPDVDFIIYGNDEYTVNSVSSVNPARGESAFIEILAR